MKAITCSIAALVLIGGAACGDDDTTHATGDAGSQVTAKAANLTVEQTDIASDTRGALALDKTLKNAWGLAFNPQGAAWVSSNGTGTSKVYKANGDEALAPVKIPAPGKAAVSAPTGQVFNDDAAAFSNDIFIFVTEDGSVAGWQLSDQGVAKQRVDNSDNMAIYKGVTIAKSGGNSQLYAADFHNGKIDVFDDSYRSLKTSGDFSDAKLPSGYAPFNIKAVNGILIVTYAKQDSNKEDDVKGQGFGYIDAFDVDGTFIARLRSKAELNAPWGIALAPKSFDAAPDRLLIGNFGDGLIHSYVFDSSDKSNPTLQLEGTLKDSGGTEIKIDGLWALEFGNNASGFSADTLYFTAGPNDEKNGLFGGLTSTKAMPGAGGQGGSTVGY
jgi:uncharacterized protein (TIGR03118 family)